MVGILAWGIVQAFLFCVSIWFLIFGLRNWSERKLLAAIIALFGFVGFYGVISSLNAIGFL